MNLWPTCICWKRRCLALFGWGVVGWSFLTSGVSSCSATQPQERSTAALPQLTDKKNKPLQSNGETAPDSTADAPAADDATDPEAVAGGFVELTSDNHANAILWVPPGNEPRPLLVVAHGAGGSPEWHCEYWRHVVEWRAFVLCLRGKPLARGEHAFYFPEHHYLKQQMLGVVASARTHYAARLAEPYVYAAYSQGATMGALVLPELAELFPLALLIEGGYAQWPVSSARRFQANGGQRVYFACGTATCKRGAERSLGWLKKSNIEAEAVTAAGAGHTPAGPVGEAAQMGLWWLTRGFEAWSQ